MDDTLENWFAREILALEPMLVRYLLRVWPNRDEVPDLRQEIYVKVFESAQQVRRWCAPMHGVDGVAGHVTSKRKMLSG